MSELALTLVRLGFLALLWVFIVALLIVLRRDLRAPSDAKPMTATPARAPRAPRPPRSARIRGAKGTALLVVEGPLKGTVVPLGTTQVTIGRAPDSTIVIEDEYASSRHARIYQSEGAWIVEDLGSTNGTWIDRTRITTPTVLPVGAPLRVGRTTLQLQK